MYQNAKENNTAACSLCNLKKQTQQTTPIELLTPHRTLYKRKTISPVVTLSEKQKQSERSINNILYMRYAILCELCVRRENSEQYIFQNNKIYENKFIFLFLVQDMMVCCGGRVLL